MCVSDVPMYGEIKEKFFSASKEYQWRSKLGMIQALSKLSETRKSPKWNLFESSIVVHSLPPDGVLYAIDQHERANLERMVLPVGSVDLISNEIIARLMRCTWCKTLWITWAEQRSSQRDSGLNNARVQGNGMQKGNKVRWCFIRNEAVSLIKELAKCLRPNNCTHGWTVVVPLMTLRNKFIHFEHLWNKTCVRWICKFSQFLYNLLKM